MIYTVHNGFVKTTISEDTFFVTGIYVRTLYAAIASVAVPLIYRYCLICRQVRSSTAHPCMAVLLQKPHTSRRSILCRAGADLGFGNSVHLSDLI